MDSTDPALSQSEPPVAQDLVFLGVAAAAEAIRNREMTSEAYASALLQRAREQADLAAFITIDEAAVLTGARAADKAIAAGSSGRLLGVPLGVKDCFLTKGLATSVGLEKLAHFVPGRDADAVQLIKNAGAVVFGKTNLVEWSYGLTGTNANFGQVKNPHARDRVTGGSSSGSAAAVAVGIVPASFGSDSVGSVRVPASLCGVVGFKPTTGRWPGDGVAPVSHTLDTPGILARCVEDCDLLDQVMTASVPERQVHGEPGLKGVRLAYAPRQFLDLVDADVEASFREGLRQLKDAGAVVVEVDLGADFNEITQQACWSLFFHETMPSVSQFLADEGIPTTFEEILSTLRPELKMAWGYMVVPGGGGAISAEAYQTVLAVSRPEIQRRLDEVFVKHGAQAIVQPTTPCTAPRIEQQTQFSIRGQAVEDRALANHTLMASLTGFPGISLPIGLSQERLPIGLELDGPSRSDRQLLALARDVEGVLGYPAWSQSDWPSLRT